MTQAAGEVVAGEVTQAVRDSVSDAGPIANGDWLGICREGIRSVEPSMFEAACGLLDVIIDNEHELLTVIAGDDADDATTDRIVEWLGANHPEIEAEVHHGGQPLYPYYFGLE